MDSNVSLKVKIVEGEGVGACSLARSTSRVEGLVRTPRWGLGKLTSNSITHTNLHKPNNKLVSAQLEHFGARTSHGQTQICKIHHNPDLGKPPPSPLQYILCLATRPTPKCHLVPRLQVRVLKFPKLGLLQFWGPITLCADLRLK